MIEQPEKTELFAELDSGEIQRRWPAKAKDYYNCIYEKHFTRLKGQVNPTKTSFGDSAEATSKIKERARELGADMVGFVKVDQAYAYKGKQINEQYAISLGMEMDYERIATTPRPEAEIEMARVYYELGEVTVHLAEYIRGLGYAALAHHPLGAGRLLQQPFAVAAGLGKLGRNGLVISKDFGPRFRLGCVTTDLSLVTESPCESVVSEFCLKCDLCLRACPGGAIAEHQTIVRGVKKYAIDGSRCRTIFNSKPGCAICIKVCPFNKPTSGRANHTAFNSD